MGRGGISCEGNAQDVNISGNVANKLKNRVSKKKLMGLTPAIACLTTRVTGRSFILGDRSFKREMGRLKGSGQHVREKELPFGNATAAKGAAYRSARGLAFRRSGKGS